MLEYIFVDSISKNLLAVTGTDVIDRQPRRLAMRSSDIAVRISVISPQSKSPDPKTSLLCE